ncbi:6935_t:CDS:2 [Gigaspora rosea]|nr:6935_t:CDS:2 [Gigaspora rosea]
MSDNIFIKYIKIINERNRTIDLRGQVLIQNSCNKEKTVTIEYTTDSWDTDNRVTATWSRKLSPNKDLYDFEILSVKSSKLPLYFEFTVLCDIAGSILWISDERKKLDELRKQLEEERKKLDEYNNEGRKKLKEERNQLDEERNQLEEIRKQLEEERRQLEKQMMEINNHEDNTNSSPSQLSNSIFVKYIKVVNEYNGVIDLQGQVVVQTIGSDKSVIIEYTTDSWITNNQVNATWSHTLSSEQDSYYFKISVSKSSNLPLYLEFTALCNVAGTVLWTNSYEYLYDVGTPKELFFNDTFTESYIDSFFPLNISKDEKKECSICAENVDIKAFLNVTDLCNHDSNICRECIGEYIKHELEDKGNINISCPLDDCHEILRERDVKEFATEDVFTRYERLMINFALSQIPTFQWCLNTSCESGQDHYQGENVPIMTCNACGQKSCVVHGIPISDGYEKRQMHSE